MDDTRFPRSETDGVGGFARARGVCKAIGNRCAALKHGDCSRLHQIHTGLLT